MKAADEEFNKSFVNVLLRDVKLMPTDVTSIVVASVVFVRVVLIVVGFLVTMV